MAGYADIGAARADFPVFGETVNGKRLAYLDTASSAQKPAIVIDRMRGVMERCYANIHRGLYHFSQETTQAYEDTRGKVAGFINGGADEIVFTRNATEAINLVAQSWGVQNLEEGDEIILSGMEHHANIVPWQLIEARCGFSIKVIPVLDDGTLDLDAFKALLSEKTKLVSVVHASNALGTINPAARIAGEAKAYNPAIRVLVDASQSAVHGGVDVRGIGCDFLAFTGHKLYGPTGVGVLWARAELLQSMPPYQGGGDMIETVSFDGTRYKSGPARFEAGTPAIVEVIGLGAAIDYVRGLGADAIGAHEKAMLDYAVRELGAVEGLNFYGRAQEKVGIISFTADWAGNADIAMILDKQGVCVRAGHHCCMPLMERFGIAGTIRASIGLYTNQDDIDQLVQGLKKAKDFLA
ncbi:MAG: cysteine desulfurase [Micavibrio sp.]